MTRPQKIITVLSFLGLAAFLHVWFCEWSISGWKDAVFPEPIRMYMDMVENENLKEGWSLPLHQKLFSYLNEHTIFQSTWYVAGATKRFPDGLYADDVSKPIAIAFGIMTPVLLIVVAILVSVRPLKK